MLVLSALPLGSASQFFFEVLVNHFSANFVLFSKIETLMLRRTHVVPCVYFLQCPPAVIVHAQLGSAR